MADILQKTLSNVFYLKQNTIFGAPSIAGCVHVLYGDHKLTHWPLGDSAVFLTLKFSKSYQREKSWTCPVISISRSESSYIMSICVSNAHKLYKLYLYFKENSNLLSKFYLNCIQRIKEIQNNANGAANFLIVISLYHYRLGSGEHIGN